MSIWGQLNLQEGMSVVIEIINYFHDYIIMLLVMIIFFVSYLFSYLLLSSKLDKYTIDSHLLETIWTILPIVILVFMAIPSLYLLYLIEEVTTPVVSVKVVGHQWYWEYEYLNSWFTYSFDSYIVYSNDISPLFYTLDVDNRLVLPSNLNILFLVTSSDVLHSWTVPALGVKADAIPGRLNYLSTYSTNSGVYYGQCREICGSNHSFMPIVLEFIPMSKYISFIASLNV
jgi:cytochrome c oxidase subunit 2